MIAQVVNEIRVGNYILTKVNMDEKAARKLSEPTLIDLDKYVDDDE